MATEAQLLEALRAADAAGNAEDAARIADLIKRQRAAAPAQEPAAREPAAAEERRAGPVRQAEAALRGVTSGLLGAGDLAAAAGDVIGGQVIGPALGGRRLPLDETFQRVRADREALESDAPLASGAGALAGAFAPVGAIAGAMRVGQPVANTLRAAGGGALMGGITEANLGGDVGDIAQAAAVSGVASPVLGGAVRLGGAGVNAFRSGIDKNSDEGFRALARVLQRKGVNSSPQQLRDNFAALKAARGGANPTLTEVAGERLAGEISDLTKGSQRATDRLIDSARAQTVDLQENLASAVGRGRPTPAPTNKQAAYRKIAMDNAMSKIGKRRVKFTADEVKKITTDQKAYSALDAETRVALGELEEAGGTISVRQVDDIRQILRQKGKGPGSLNARLRDLATRITQDAEDQVPEYGRALRSFGNRAQREAGTKMGRRIISEPDTEAFKFAAETASPAAQVGIRGGARQVLEDEARGSPDKAFGMARALAEDSGLARRLSAIDADEAARLAKVGAAERDAARSVGMTLKSTGKVKGAQAAGDAATRDAADAMLALTGAGSLSFKVSAANRLRTQFRVPPTAATKLADALTDPSRTEETINLLARYGVEPRVIEQMARAANRATSRTAGPASTEPEYE